MFIVNPPCPICGSEDKFIIFHGNLPSETADYDPVLYACTSSHLAKYVDIVRCASCDVLYLSSRPDDKSLTKLYSDVVDHTYVAEGGGRHRTFATALADLNSIALYKGNMLEVGAYTGIFMELAQKSGWTVTGVEISKWAREEAFKARGLSLKASFDEVDDNLAGKFDCVVMWDVIEHVPYPDEYIKKSWGFLKKGGILALSTITLDSLSARLLSSHYPFLMQMHLVYFTRKTLVNLLEKNGFRVVSYKRHKRYVTYAYLFSKFSFLSHLLKINFLRYFLEKNYFISSVGLRDIYAVKEQD